MNVEQVTLNFKAMNKKWISQGELSINTRQDYLSRLASLLQNHTQELSSALNDDFLHRSKNETFLLELFPAINAIKYCLKYVKTWSKPRRKKVSYLFQPAKAYIQPQALGIVGNMSPWNYPVYLALVPTAYALAAGNRVMIKISELTPKTGNVLASLIEKLFPEGDIRVINGDVEIAKCFASLPFGHLIFTGSTSVGRQVMRAASENLTPVTLELGGKSPALISYSCAKKYFQRLLMGKCFNAGQTCIAPDYVLIPQDMTLRFEQYARDFLKKRYPFMPSDDDYSSIISQERFKRLIHLIEDAKQKGAEVVSYGDVDSVNRKIPLNLIFNVADDMLIMQEEIFGPILPIIPYHKYEQAVTYIDKHRHPLALYYFGKCKKEIEILRIRHLSGALTINDTITHVAIDDLPFGGVGESGMGCYHGREGFERFSLMKPIFVQRRIALVTWFYPPYGRLVHLFLTWVGRLKLRGKS